MQLLNSLKNLYLTTQPKPWKLQKPVVIQFPVNDICNSKCQMCNIWKQKFDYQITSQNLEEVLSSTLFSEVKGVGVNGGEPTLREDLPELIDVLFRKLPKLSNIALITNSLNSSQVIERINEIGQVIKSYSGYLGVMVSLDGYGEIHDRVRGRKGNFENALKVIDFIQSSDLVSSYSLGCTVIKENIFDLHNLLEFALNKRIYIKYRLGIPHQRLYSKNIVEPFELDFEEKYHFAIFLQNLIKFYEKSRQQNYFYKSLIDQLTYRKPRTAGCDWQYRGATLSARGELLYCAVESKTLGSAISGDPKKLYFDNEQHLANIVQTKCDTCTHDYVGLPSSQVLLKDYLAKLFRKIGIDIGDVKKLQILQPIQLIQQKVSFTKKISQYGLNQLKLSKLQPAQSFPKNSSSKSKILICGWYGTETLGDKLILAGIICALKYSLPNIALHLVSLEPYISEMTIRQMPELQGCKLYSVTDALKIVKNMDLVLFGGGPLMAIFQLIEMTAIFEKAVEAKVPTLIAGCGVGPLGANYCNDAIKNLLLLASHRIYRDFESKKIAESLGIDISLDKVAEDPAFTWFEVYEKNNKASVTPNTKSGCITLLLGLRDWPYREYASCLSISDAEKIKDNFEKEVVLALEQLLNQYPNLKIIPFPMCTNHIGNDDRWFYRRLFRNSKNIHKALDFAYLGRELSPLEAIDCYKSANIALTMRFHSLVCALSTGVPAVAIDYTLGRGKVKSLAVEYHVPHRSLDLVNAEFLVSCLSQLIEENTDNYHLPSSKRKLHFNDDVADFIRFLKG